MVKVANKKIIKRTVFDNKKLDKYIKLVGKNLLPSAPWYEVSFELHDCYSEFANAIRRVLIGELSVKCLTFSDENFSTDDEFILTDVFQKAVNLIPMNQDIDKLGKVSLEIENKTSKVLDVKASDIKHGGIFPNDNILICRLRPGKKLKVTAFEIIEGKSEDDAAKFTLLNNVSYDILDMEPYDHFTGKGTRSIEYDPTKFRIGFKTASNIMVKSVFKKLQTRIVDMMEKAKQQISHFDKSNSNDKFYFEDDFETSTKENIRTYKFYNEYITLAFLLAKKAYLLDPNVLFCTPTIDRYDNNVAIVRINHPNSNKLLIKACDEVIKEVNNVVKALN